MRVSATEEEKFITNTFIKDAHFQLQEKAIEIAHLSSEGEQMHKLLSTAMAEASECQSLVHAAKKETDALRNKHKEVLLE